MGLGLQGAGGLFSNELENPCGHDIQGGFQGQPHERLVQQIGGVVFDDVQYFFGSRVKSEFLAVLRQFKLSG